MLGLVLCHIWVWNLSIKQHVRKQFCEGYLCPKPTVFILGEALVLNEVLIRGHVRYQRDCTEVYSAITGHQIRERPAAKRAQITPGGVARFD